MAFLSGLLGGGRRRRGYGGFGASRAYGRAPASSGFLASPLARMALGGLAAYGARRFYNSRRGASASASSLGSAASLGGQRLGGSQSQPFDGYPNQQL